jgi:biopolymer transport protein ExbB
MVYEFIQEGGVWMWPILLISVVGLMFMLERTWFWLTLWLRSDHRLRRRLLHGEVPAVGTRTRDPHALVLLYLAHYPDDEDLPLEQAKILVRDSRAHLKVLAICAGLGSALGLFGTVVGMSSSFRGVGLGDPSAIVRGLHGALNTTVLGLVVYVVTYTAHAFFAQQSVNLSNDLEEDLNTTRRALDTQARRNVSARPAAQPPAPPPRARSVPARGPA